MAICSYIGRIQNGRPKSRMDIDRNQLKPIVHFKYIGRRLCFTSNYLAQLQTSNPTHKNCSSIYYCVLTSELKITIFSSLVLTQYRDEQRATHLEFCVRAHVALRML